MISGTREESDTVHLDELGDPQQFVRRQQPRFFRTGTYGPEDMASQIAAEAVLGGAREVRVSIDPEWIVIQGDVDWLESVDGDAFANLTVFPPGGPTDTTREVLAVTFSVGVVTATASGVRVVKGDSRGPVLEPPIQGRVVAFRVAFS